MSPLSTCSGPTTQNLVPNINCTGTGSDPWQLGACSAAPDCSSPEVPAHQETIQATAASHEAFLWCLGPQPKIRAPLIALMPCKPLADTLATQVCRTKALVHRHHSRIGEDVGTTNMFALQVAQQESPTTMHISPVAQGVWKIMA